MQEKSPVEVQSIFAVMEDIMGYSDDDMARNIKNVGAPTFYVLTNKDKCMVQQRSCIRVYWNPVQKRWAEIITCSQAVFMNPAGPSIRHWARRTSDIDQGH